MSNTNELRLFISSTFQDLQEEREHLVKKIFPEIRSLCRERGITFTEVDLRWGLTDEDVALGQVIRTCLDEVDQCRPYFIGITGDRYGFVPTYLDIQKDPALLRDFPWIEDATIDGMSITELEAQHAVLSHSPLPVGEGPGERARFYFRRQRETFDDDPADNEELRRLEEYQARIQASGASIERFRDPVSLGKLIYDDLVKIIKQNFADAKPPTPLEEERARHEAFSLSRRRAYIANPTYLKRLNDHTTSDGPPLIVYAESGSGKSSLFAFWAEQYRRKHPDAHVIEHYVGIGATATAHYAIIRHICMEINDRFGRDQEIPSEPAKLQMALGQWFGYADHALKQQGASMVLILDGLNQLQGDALNLRWIPDVISPSIRLIVSSTVEGTLVELEKRGWSRFGMQALSEAERETIVVRYLAEYRKSLNAEQIKRIASDYKCGHPLFLKTVLEELRLVSRHEELDATIDSYLEATGTEDLFQRMLERLEEDHTMRAVRDVMTLLSTSRSGLDERELSEVSSLARLKIATMTAGLDYHLVRKDGRLTFFHDYLRRAVEKRYLSDPQMQLAAHRQLAEYFQKAVSTAIEQGVGITVRMAGELAYQLNAAGEHDRLHECLSTMPVFMALCSGRTRFEMLGYWSVVTDASVIDTYYRQGVDRWEVPDGRERSAGVGCVVEFLQALGRWPIAIELCRERLALAVGRGDVLDEAAWRASLGSLLVSRSEYDEALGELLRALDLYTELGDRRGVGTAQENMGMVYYNRGEYEQARESFEVQLRISEEVGNLGGVASAHGNIGVVYLNRGVYDRALERFGVQLRINEEAGDRKGVAVAKVNQGIVYERRGEHERALECYGVCLHISEELGNRRTVATVQRNIGNLYTGRGEHERALECFGVCLRISEELGDRLGVAMVQGSIASVYSSRGEYDQALKSYGVSLRISEELGDRLAVAVAHGNMGNVFSSRGEYERALDQYRQAAAEHRQLGFRFGLSYWLVGTARVLLELVEGSQEMPEFVAQYVLGAEGVTWRELSLRIAREQAEESVAISEELAKRDTLFDGRVLLARIDAAEGDREVAVQRLGQILEEATDDDQKAELHYRLWKMSAVCGVEPEECEVHRAEALRLHQAIVEQMPMHEHRKRIGELNDSPDSSL